MSKIDPNAQGKLDLTDSAETSVADAQVEITLDNQAKDNREPEKKARQTPIRETSLKSFGLALLIAMVVIALDQWTKQIASSKLELYRPIEVFDWLNMTLAHNRGAAFSFLSDAGGWQRWFFSILASVISVILLVWIYRLPDRERVNLVALSLIFAGAVGNLIDRLRFGYVVDFIDAHLQASHWPAFNLADSAISVGVVLLIIGMFLYPQKVK